MLDIVQAVINMSLLVVLRWFIGKRYSGWLGLSILGLLCLIAFFLDWLKLGTLIDFSPVTWRFVILIFILFLLFAIVWWLNTYWFAPYDIFPSEPLFITII